jgi:MFS family permease
VTTSAASPQIGGSAPNTPAPPMTIPWLGLAAVLMGAFISTLNGRLSTFGLADIRGAVGAGFDEGAWITTAQTVAQMFVTLLAVWMGAAYGARRVLIWTSLLFAIVSLLTPFCETLPSILAMQFLGGLAFGFFIPLTLSFVLLNMPPKYWAFGIAVYALNLELSLNISASLEGWYTEHHSWRWIFWQNVPLALIMTLCLHRGIANKPITTKPPFDLYALLAGGAGLALIYAALDQGNRLDWLNSDLVCALLVGGAVLLVAFFVHEARTPNPLINLKVVFGSPMPSQFLLIAFFRLTVLATSYLIPLYLGAVRGYRALEVGDTLIWIAMPQLIFCPLAALMLRRSDARLVAAIGFIFISVACLMVAYNLTPIWGSTQFLPSALLAGARTELCSLRRHLLRDSPSAIEGCAHFRCSAADRTPYGRRGGIGLHHHTHPDARAGGIEFDWSAHTEISQLSTNAGLSWGVGPAISWTFPNQVRARAQIRQAKAGQAAALATFDSAVLTALKETEQALTTYRAALDQHQALVSAQARIHRSFDIARDQFAAGSLSPLDLLTTEQSLVALDAAVSASDSTLIEDQIATFKALGGGWQSDTSAPR